MTILYRWKQKQKHHQKFLHLILDGVKYPIIYRKIYKVCPFIHWSIWIKFNFFDISHQLGVVPCLIEKLLRDEYFIDQCETEVDTISVKKRDEWMGWQTGAHSMTTDIDNIHTQTSKNRWVAPLVSVRSNDETEKDVPSFVILAENGLLARYSSLWLTILKTNSCAHSVSYNKCR